jgi:hypothetical protein
MPGRCLMAFVWDVYLCRGLVTPTLGARRTRVRQGARQEACPDQYSADMSVFQVTSGGMSINTT